MPSASRARSAWPTLAALLAAAALGRGAVAAPRSAADWPGEAALLVRWGGEALADPSIESRQRAIRDLRRALELDPRNADAWLLLGRAHEMGGLGHLGRQCFHAASQIDPGRVECWVEMGQSYKRDYLRTLDPASLDSARAAFTAAATLRPAAADAWLGLVPMRYEESDLAGAEFAACRALAGYPRRPEALLAYACMAFRRGEIERADSAFIAVMPRLHPSLRKLFDRPDWIGVAPAAPAAGAAWEGLDPDPTTRANELQLEYCSRVAYAFLLFADPTQPELDARAETYVRYGPPARVQLNPPGSAGTVQYLHARPGRDIVASNYPADAQVWSYPQLGMRVQLQDRSLTGRFTPVAARDFDASARPDPRVLALRGDLVALGDGMAVFPTRPPREQSLDVRAVVSRFAAGARRRLVAYVQAPGDPAGRVRARWVVSDSLGREWARDTIALGVSACDPAERRVGELSCELPPGAFDIVISASDDQRKRGLYRTRVEVGAATAGLSLSDIVLSCGDASARVGEREVRLEANADATVPRTRPLAAYCEIAQLAVGPDGRSRFELEYFVRPAPEPGGERRRPQAGDEASRSLSATREETQVGTLRRQFVSVPTQRLEPGRYRLGIRVRDLIAGTAAEGAVVFTRE